VAARGGIFSACTPAAADTASNAALNVASSSRIRNRTVPPLAEIHEQVADGLTTQSRVGR